MYIGRVEDVDRALAEAKTKREALQGVEEDPEEIAEQVKQPLITQPSFKI